MHFYSVSSSILQIRQGKLVNTADTVDSVELEQTPMHFHPVVDSVVLGVVWLLPMQMPFLLEVEDSVGDLPTLMLKLILDTSDKLI
jgi:hypothetical protein